MIPIESAWFSLENKPMVKTHAPAKSHLKNLFQDISFTASIKIKTVPRIVVATRGSESPEM